MGITVVSLLTGDIKLGAEGVEVLNFQIDDQALE
jgi:hypothetical protein